MYTIKRYYMFTFYQVEDVAMVEDLGRWENMLSKHDKLVWKLEKAKVKTTLFYFFGLQF